MIDWPELPRRIGGLSGPIEILRPIVLPDRCYGDWEPDGRIIRVEAALKRETAMRYLFHELTHAAIHEVALEAEIPEGLQEPLTGAMSCQMMHVARWLLTAKRDRGKG